MLTRAREWWENLGRNNQIVVAASSLGGLIALIGFIAWASTPEYVQLFSGLSAQDSNAIIEKLKEANVPYRLLRGGEAIEVPAQNQPELKMRLLSQGLPQQAAVMGNELFDKDNSPFKTGPMEAELIRRAKEGEITKSILTLQQVAGALVHIAPADDTLFTRDKHDASASVVLTLHPGHSLSEESVNAIVRLVQMSYTGLSEKNITVASSRGELLFDGTRIGTAQGLERKKLDHARAQELSIQLQSLLDSTLGPRKASVICNYESTADQEQTKKTIVEPGAVISKTSQEEDLKGRGSMQGAAPGAGANVGGVAAGATRTPGYVGTNDSDGSFKSTSTTSTSQPSITETVITRPEGRLEKLTISALIDTSVSQQDANKIADILKNHIGYTPNDPSRSVTVSQIPFDRSAEETEAKAAAAARSAENTANMVKVLAPLALMLFCLFLLARALRKHRPVPVESPFALAGAEGGMPLALPGGTLAYGPDGLPLSGQTVGEALTTVDEHGNIIAITPDSGPKMFEVIEEAFDAHLESITHLAKTKPETVAALIKSWMVEEGNSK